MAEPPRQLALDLPVETRFEVEDFHVSDCNDTACNFLEAWPDWPGKVALLYGAAGAGKSHLASIWSRRAGAVRLDAARLRPEHGVPGAAVIEDADRLLADEASLFHILNTVRERGASLLLTARAPAALWPLKLADLQSRLKLAPAVEILPPDDSLLRLVLVKQFFDRQIVVDTRLVEYIAARIERSFAACGAIVERLDREGLERGRRVSRAIAAEILAAGSL